MTKNHFEVTARNLSYLEKQNVEIIFKKGTFVFINHKKKALVV